MSSLVKHEGIYGEIRRVVIFMMQQIFLNRFRGARNCQMHEVLMALELGWKQWEIKHNM